MGLCVRPIWRLPFPIIALHNAPSPANQYMYALSDTRFVINRVFFQFCLALKQNNKTLKRPWILWQECCMNPVILSSFITLHIHRSILISTTSNLFSCALFNAHVSDPYISAGLTTVLYTFPLIFTFILLSHKKNQSSHWIVSPRLPRVVDCATCWPVCSRRDGTSAGSWWNSSVPVATSSTRSIARNEVSPDLMRSSWRRTYTIRSDKWWILGVRMIVVKICLGYVGPSIYRCSGYYVSVKHTLTYPKFTASGIFLVFINFYLQISPFERLLSFHKQIQAVY